MKTKLIPTLALVSAFFITTPSYAGDNKAENQSVKTTTSIISPRDAASGLPTGKRIHKPFNTTKHIDKSSPQMAKAAYKKCPDGSMINPGEKCPEKTVRAGYRLCPDGSMINPGEKCPEKSKHNFKPNRLELKR